MHLARSGKPGWALLLAALIFSSAWGGVVTRLRPGRSTCTAGAHACCCAPAGLGQCCCAGQHGAAAQLASLTACAGAPETAAFLLELPPAMPAPAAVGAPPPETRSPVSMAGLVLPLSTDPDPATPPPQAA
jgi:hypothetical protein